MNICAVVHMHTIIRPLQYSRYFKYTSTCSTDGSENRRDVHGDDGKDKKTRVYVHVWILWTFPMGIRSTGRAGTRLPDCVDMTTKSAEEKTNKHFCYELTTRLHFLYERGEREEEATVKPWDSKRSSFIDNQGENTCILIHVLTQCSGCSGRPDPETLGAALSLSSLLKNHTTIRLYNTSSNSLDFVLLSWKCTASKLSAGTCTGTWISDDHLHDVWLGCRYQ